MGKRIVIALGGNALGNNLPEQMIAVRQTARAIVDLIEQGHEVVIAHGNGPQVGMIQNAMTELTRSNPEKYIPCPLSVCVAMSQGYIGYDLQNALREEMLSRGIQKGVATVLTQVEVDAGLVVIACGGGGIPVFKTEGFHLKGAAAVIDKDFAASCLARQLDADCLIILTAVEKVAIHFGKPDVQWLSELTPDVARQYIADGEFAPGSMLPKVQAALEFAESKPGRTALITLLEKAREGIAGETGTQIHL